MVEAASSRPASLRQEQHLTKDKTVATTLVGAHGLEHFYANSFPVLVTAIYESLGLDPIQAGILSAVRQVTGGLTSIFSGFFVDIFLHRSGQVLGLSMGLIGLGYLLVALSPNYAAILGALIVASAGSALWHPPALGLLARRFPLRRGLYISLHRSTGNFGDLAGPLIAGTLLGLMSWRWIMGGGTPFLMVMGVAVLLLLRNVGGLKFGPIAFRSKMKSQFASLREAFRGTGMWAIFTVSAVRGMGDRSYIFFLPLYLRNVLDMGYGWVGVHIALVAAPGIISGPLFGALSDRIGRRSVIAFLMIVSVALSITTVLAGGGVGMTLSVALFGLFHSSVNSLTQAAAIDEAEGKGLDATFMGLMWGNNAAFGAVSGVGVGALIKFFGWEVAFYFAAAMFFLGFLVALAIPGKRASLPQAA